MNIVSLAEAVDAGTYGGKAVQLGAALRAGLPVPGGLAVPWPVVEEVSAGESSALDDVELPELCAVRSSAIGEDSENASFAGAHLSVLGVSGRPAVVQAISDVRASGHDPGALAYRAQMGVTEPPRMAAVVQSLVDADAAGVMFTRHPITGACQLVIEASWGLGESVVSGLVTPDHYVLGVDGELIEQTIGEKDIELRRTPDGSTAEYLVEPERAEISCLGELELAMLRGLAMACDEVFGTTGHDIEFAFAHGHVHLLQRRPITHG